MLALILSMVIWGTLGVFVLWSGVPALDVAFYRCLIGVLFIGLWLLRARERVAFDKSTIVVALAGICLVMNWVFLFKSFQISTITIGNISYYLQPVILIILGILIFKEKVSIQQWGLILMALTGVILTIDIRSFISPHMVLGVFYALLAAVLYSFLTIFMKPVRMNYFNIIFIQLTIGMVILFPFVHFHKLGLMAVSCLILIGVIHTLLAYYLYYRAIITASFSQIAVASYLDPIVAIATDVLFFHRELNVYQIAGIGLTFAALYWLVTASKSRDLVPA